jgi:CheY-like chemotaxis protein
MQTTDRHIVLLADENGAVRALHATFLLEAGFEAVEADTCEAAINLACLLRPHAVLASCDGAADGIRLAHALAARDEAKVIPVILVADSARNVPGRLAEDVWIHSILSKPCPREELLTHVRHAVGQGLELRRILALTSPPPVQDPGNPGAAESSRPVVQGRPWVSDRRGEAGGPFPCPACGQDALVAIGKTTYSVVLLCEACREVLVEGRS